MVKREAYPQGFKYAPKEPFNLKKWKDTALKIRMAMREYPEHSPSDVLTHFVNKWDYQEREAFRKWWHYNQTRQGQQSMSMTKTAYDYSSADKEQKLNELRKKLRSRVNSAERLLNKMIDEGLLGGNEDKALYIGRILQKLKEEINLLKRPQLMEARHNRARRICRSAGLTELSDILRGSVDIIASFGQEKMVKMAAEGDVGRALQLIKSELDTFNYGEHLETFMQIRSELLAAGRHSEASMVVDIIKKELSNIDGIHKKLVELYTNLSQIPRERKEPKTEVTKSREPRIERPEPQPAMPQRELPRV